MSATPTLQDTAGNTVLCWLATVDQTGQPSVSPKEIWHLEDDHVLIAVLIITLVLLLGASFIHRSIGATGASVISRVMGIVLATIAVDAVLGGFDALGIFNVAPPE